MRHRGVWPPPDGAPTVAIVGARRCSPYGEAVAERLAGDLAAAGVAILSGLATGIDTAAHEGALAVGGYTAAVMGTGVDVVYPRANAALAARILDAGGALISQFPDGTPPRRVHFPMRNHLLADLSRAVVVVEAGEGSGAMITAEAALHMNKDVLAVPGSVFSPLSVGCHQLLRDGAGLVQNARDVLAALGRSLEVLDDALRPPPSLAALRAPAGALIDPLVRHLSEVLPMTAGELARKLDLPYPEVVARLTALELDGVIARRGPGYIRLTARPSRA